MFMITAVGTPVYLKEVAHVPMEKQDELLYGKLENHLNEEKASGNNN
ncbi:hypothetical protein [Sphingobacterium sp. WOUb80]